MFQVAAGPFESVSLIAAILASVESLLVLEPAHAATLGPVLDHQAIARLVEADHHHLGELGAEKVKARRRLGLGVVASRPCRLVGAKPVEVGDLLDPAGELGVSSQPGGSAEALCSAKRGSRWRSRALRAPHIEPNHSSPSTKSASVPLIRGEPSRRRVAIVLWTPASKRRLTASASSGSAAAKSPRWPSTDRSHRRSGGDDPVAPPSLSSAGPGEVTEWLKVRDWKSCGRCKLPRGFESHPLRYFPA